MLRRLGRTIPSFHGLPSRIFALGRRIRWFNFALRMQMFARGITKSDYFGGADEILPRDRATGEAKGNPAGKKHMNNLKVLGLGFCEEMTGNRQLGDNLSPIAS